MFKCYDLECPPLPFPKLRERMNSYWLGVTTVNYHRTQSQNYNLREIYGTHCHLKLSLDLANNNNKQ